LRKYFFCVSSTVHVLIIENFINDTTSTTPAKVIISRLTALFHPRATSSIRSTTSSTSPLLFSRLQTSTYRREHVCFRNRRYRFGTTTKTPVASTAASFSHQKTRPPLWKTTSMTSTTSPLADQAQVLAACMARLQLSAPPQSIAHATVHNAAEWQHVLAGASGVPSAFALTKTLLLKSKAAKAGADGLPPPTILVVALEQSAVPLTPLAKHLKEKEVRFANEELLMQVLGLGKEAGIFIMRRRSQGVCVLIGNFII
jgi:hypothetical protein